VLPVIVLGLAVLDAVSPWLVLPALLSLPVAAALAVDRYRRLGHALTAEHVVFRYGSLRGRRDVLQRTGIIGWNLHQSWFQRRAGVATLVATTAAGQQAYALLDVPLPVAVALADEAVPGLVGQFVDRRVR
jgi:putative membrane protein